METTAPLTDSSLHTSNPDESTWQFDMEELIAAAKAHVELCNTPGSGANRKGFSFTPKVPPPGVTRLWVKTCAGTPSLEGEYNTQEYVYNEITKAGPPISPEFHVPKVYAYADFEVEVEPTEAYPDNYFPHSCIAMEFVTGTPLSEIMRPTLWSRDLIESQKKKLLRPYKDRVAHFLSFLLSLEPPPDAAPTPVNGGRMKNFVFGLDYSDGPCIFETLEQLQDWVNQENEKIRLNPYLPAAADLVSEGLRLCYCDINFDDFLLEDPDDPNSRLTIIDFEHTAWLPFSFLIWALWHKREVYIVEQVTSQTGMEIPRWNVEALHNIFLQRRWQ